MADSPRIFIVAATERELAASDRWIAVRCGVGPVEAAAATAAAIALYHPHAVVHVGIAGARRASGIVPPEIVIGREARYDDLGGPSKWAPNSVAPSALLLAAAQRVLPTARTLTIGTSAHVGGTSDCDVEAMEGFAVLRAAELAGVPAIEIRAISNAIEERDRARWRFDDAFAAITAVTPRLVAEIAAALSTA
jgi:futalosine hydrolase